MSRVKRGVTAHARHKKVIKAAKGYFGRRKNVFRAAVEAETTRQQRLLDHELRNARATDPASIFTRAASALAGPDYEAKEDES